MSFAALLLLTLLPAGTIQGVVRAEGSGGPIPSATVGFPELRRSAVTDERGFFVVSDVPAGSWRARVSALGFRPMQVVVEVPRTGAVRLEVELAERPIRIETLEVRTDEGGAAAGSDAAGPGELRLSADALRAVPGLAEPDILRAVQMLPSVAAGSDFSSALYVRGGSPDQNLVTLDGVPLFNPYHLGGIFGAIDPDAVRSVGVLAGAFPAGTGDRLSSAIDIRSREGGRDRVRGFGSLGLVSSRLGADGPLPDGRGSWLVSARRTYLDPISRGAEALGAIDFHLPYGFTDVYAHAVHDMGKLGKLSASAYLNREALRIDRSLGEDVYADFRWGSHALGLRYWQPFGAAWAGEVRAAWSGFGGRWDAGEYLILDEPGRDPFAPQRRADTVSYTLRSNVGNRDLLVGAGVTRYGRSHDIRAGVQADWYRFDYNVQPGGEETGIDDEVDDFLPRFRRSDGPRTLAVYLEDEWRPDDRLRLRGGIRVLAAGERGTAVMPRLGMRYALTPQLALTAGAGRSAQVMHSLRDQEAIASSVVAYDLLAAVPEEIGLTVADDAVLGAEWRRGGTALRVEGYEKRFRRLPVSPIPEDLLETAVIVPDQFRRGTGLARGLEVTAGHTRGSSGASLAYALARSERETDGERFAPRWERRHTLDLNAHTGWGPRGQLSARLVAATGQPYTPVVGFTQRTFYDPAEQALQTYPYDRTLPVLGDHNSARLPGYLRLDVGARRSYERRPFGRRTTITPYAQVLNVLNTKNVLFADLQRGYSPVPEEDGRLEEQYIPQLPVFPTLGVEWAF